MKSKNLSITNTEETSKIVDTYSAKVLKCLARYDSITCLNTELGEDETSWDNPEYYHYTEKDVEIMLELVSEAFAKENFKTVTPTAFNEMVQTFFGFDLSKSSKYIIHHNNYYTYTTPKEYESWKGRIRDNMEFESSQIFACKQGFYLRSLDPPTRLFDISDSGDSVSLSPYIIHLNKWLFNNNKASLTWLKNNAPYYPESFVLDFGYTKDSDLLKWTLDRNKFYCDYENDKNNIDKFTKILTHRKDDGTLVFNNDVLNYIEKNLSENYIGQITSYIHTTSSSYKEPTILTREFSFSERAELYARLLFWGECIVRNYDAPYKHYVYNFMVTFCEKNKNFEEYTKEFKSNNYYNLPHFEEYWNIARDKFYNPENPERSPFIPEDEG